MIYYQLYLGLPEANPLDLPEIIAGLHLHDIA